MADDASLESFLAAAAPLRHGRSFDPLRMFELLDALAFDGDDPLSPPLDEARKVSLVAMGAPAARNDAIARYALERIAIEIERRLRSAARPPDLLAANRHAPSGNDASIRLRQS